MIIYYIQNMNPTWYPSTKINQNVTLVYVKDSILDKKYELTCPSPPNNTTILYIDTSFHILFHRGHKHDDPYFYEEGEAIHIGGPTSQPAQLPIPPPALVMIK